MRIPMKGCGFAATLRLDRQTGGRRKSDYVSFMLLYENYNLKFEFGHKNVSRNVQALLFVCVSSESAFVSKSNPSIDSSV